MTLLSILGTRCSRVTSTLRLLCTRPPSGPGAKPTMRFQPTGINKNLGVKDPRFKVDKVTGFGRAIRMIGVGLAGFVVIIVPDFGPNSFWISFMADSVQHYGKGMPTKVSAEMAALFRQVVLDVEVKTEFVRNINFGVGYPQEVISYGGISSVAFGCYIFYPNHFHYATADDIPLNKFRFGTEPLPPSKLNSAAAAEFKSALILSENAKKFALAREICNGQQELYRRVTIQAIAACGLAYLGSRFANRSLNLAKGPVLYRVLSYTIFYGVIGLAHVLLRDFQMNRASDQCDEFACKLGPEYAEGGVEYYSQLLKKQKAARELSKTFEKQFNLHGDFYPGLLSNSVRPISVRLSRCKEFLEEIQ